MIMAENILGSNDNNTAKTDKVEQEPSVILDYSIEVFGKI